MKKTKPLALLGLAFLLGAPIARAAEDEPQFIGAFREWSTFSYKENGSLVCYAATVPAKQEGDEASREDTYILVTHRPGEKKFGVVSITAGYSYKEGSETEAVIDKATRKLFTKDDKAWAYDDAGDKALVAAMKKGTTLVVKGSSARGTSTTDTYALAGFTAAYDSITKACKGK